MNIVNLRSATAAVPDGMRVHLVNPSDISFGTAVITPRWLYVLASATPKAFGDAIICDETLELLNPLNVNPGDVVGIGIHTGNALRGYEVGKAARERGAWVIFGGIHATLYPEEAIERGGAHGVVRGGGLAAWRIVRCNPWCDGGYDPVPPPATPPPVTRHGRATER